MGTFILFLLMTGFFLQVLANAGAHGHMHGDWRIWRAVLAGCLVSLVFILFSLLTCPTVYFDAARPWDEAYRNLCLQVEAERKTSTDPSEAATPDNASFVASASDGHATDGVAEVVMLLRQQNALLEAKLTAVVAKLEDVSTRLEGPRL